jgi:hypothetical protein
MTISPHLPADPARPQLPARLINLDDLLDALHDMFAGTVECEDIPLSEIVTRLDLFMYDLCLLLVRQFAAADAPERVLGADYTRFLRALVGDDPDAADEAVG